MSRFAQLPAEAKRSQVRELATLVVGVRLFNRSLGSGGDDLWMPTGAAASPPASPARPCSRSAREACALAQPPGGDAQATPLRALWRLAPS